MLVDIQKVWPTYSTGPSPIGSHNLACFTVNKYSKFRTIYSNRFFYLFFIFDFLGNSLYLIKCYMHFHFPRNKPSFFLQPIFIFSKWTLAFQQSIQHAAPKPKISPTSLFLKWAKARYKPRLKFGRKNRKKELSTGLVCVSVCFSILHFYVRVLNFGQQLNLRAYPKQRNS